MRPRAHPRRPARAILLASSILSIATTIGLSWTIFHYTRYGWLGPMHATAQYRFGPENRLTFVDHFRGLGIAEIACVAHWLQPWGTPPAPDTLRIYPSAPGPRYPAWAILADDAVPQWTVRAAGWPALALAGAELTTFDKDPYSGDLRMVYTYRYCLGAADSYGTPARRALPWRPIAGGMAIDFVFWWFVWAALGLGAAAVIRIARARGRTRRGRCSDCGYDLAGLNTPQCPECGHRISISTGKEGLRPNAGDP